MSETIKFCISKKALLFIKRTLGSMVDEAKFRITPDGLKAVIVDPAHVCMVRLEMPKEAMNKLSVRYECLEEQVVGIDLDALSHNLLSKSIGDAIGLTITEKSITMELVFSQLTIDDWSDRLTVSRQFLRVSTEGMSDARWPSLGFRASFVTSGEHFAKAMSFLSEYSDHIGFKAGGTVVAEAVDANFMPQSVVLSRRPELDKGTASVKALFPADYLVNIANALKDCARVRVHLKNDMPLYIVAEHEGVKVEFIMAPRISE
jgi:proliferating cell nuclear antigen